MDLSIPAAGMQAASTAFDAAADSISRAYSNNPLTNSASSSDASTTLTAGSTKGDSVDLSTSFVNLISSNLDFAANTKVATIDQEMNESTFSFLA